MSVRRLALRADDEERAERDAEIDLWNLEAITFARDLLFVLGIFAYLIGFAFHSAKMARFGMETDLSEQPLTSLVTWAAEAIQEGWLGFVVIFAFVLTLMSLAGYWKHALAQSPVYRPVVYGIVTFAVVSGIVLSYGWSSAAGICMAERTWESDAKLPRILVQPVRNVSLPGVAVDSRAPTPVQLLAETTNAYQVLVVQPPPLNPVPMAIPRGFVLSIEYVPPLDNAVAHASAVVPVEFPTPDASLRGAAIASTAAVTPVRHRCLPGLVY